MDILNFILGRASPNTSNGVNKVIAGHAKYINQCGHRSYVVGVSSSQKESYKLMQRDGFEVECYNSYYRGSFNRIKELAPECDVVHLHSVWNNYNLFVASYLHKIGKPYVLTVHAGLTEDRLKQSRYWFKKCYHALLQRRMFDRAAGIHALTREEATVLRAHTSNNNIFCVQNGQDLDGVSLQAKTYEQQSVKIRVDLLAAFLLKKMLMV